MLITMSFLDHVHLECTQRECKPNEGMVDEYRHMFESRISAAATEKVHESKKIGANATHEKICEDMC